MKSIFKKIMVISLVISLSLSLTGMPHAYAEDFITTKTNEQIYLTGQHHAVDGQRAVFGGNGNGDIFYYNGNELIKLLDFDNSFIASQTVLNGDHIAWIQRQEGSQIAKLMLYNLSTGQLKEVASSINFYGIDIYGSNLVWSAYTDSYYQIFVYDIAGDSIEQLSGGQDNILPQVSGTMIAWIVGDTNSAVSVMNIATGAVNSIATTARNGSLYLEGNDVVWSGFDGVSTTTQEIFWYNGNQTTQITSDSTPDSVPRISGSHIVWINSGTRAMSYDISFGTTQLIAEHSDFISVDGNRLVYSSATTYNPGGPMYLDLFTKNLTTQETTQFTNLGYTSFQGAAVSSSIAIYAEGQYITKFGVSLAKPIVVTYDPVTNSPPTLSWGVVGGAVVYEIYRNGVLISTVTSTNFTDTGLAIDGPYSYAVRALGQYGSSPSNLSDPVNITYDTTEPTLTNPTVISPLIIGNQSVTISANAADVTSGVKNGEYYVDVDPGVGQGKPMAYANGKITAAGPLGISTGTHRVYIRAFDNAGNVSAQVSAAVIRIL